MIKTTAGRGADAIGKFQPLLVARDDIALPGEEPGEAD
jgi:hypothetical protein